MLVFTQSILTQEKRQQTWKLDLYAVPSFMEYGAHFLAWKKVAKLECILYSESKIFTIMELIFFWSPLQK